MAEKKYDLEERTLTFAKNVRDFLKLVPSLIFTISNFFGFQISNLVLINVDSCYFKLCYEAF